VSQLVRQADSVLTSDVLTHLEAQLSSVRGLLQVVLEQGTAIRERNVPAVVTLTGVLQGELQRRSTLEQERARLLERAGSRLGVSAGAVTLGLLTELMEPEAAALAEAKSAELRGLLEVVQREHYCNRALMSQELAFLDHLLRLAGIGGETRYGSAGDRVATTAAQATGHRVLDVEV
jgi:6,7-dimethyl-8-ribityllumazine synthase